jgi:hypothetical protein
MQRHHRNAASRVGLGTLIVGIALSLMAFGMSPAQASTAPAAAKTSAAASKHTAPTARPCGPGVQRIATRCVVTGPQQFSEGGCGFLQRCVYLNRSEQLYLISGSKWIVQAALCAAGVGIGCVVAGGIVELAAQWLMSRGGICPTSKPKLRVRYFPTPQIDGCVV